MLIRSGRGCAKLPCTLCSEVTRTWDAPYYIMGDPANDDTRAALPAVGRRTEENDRSFLARFRNPGIYFPFYTQIIACSSSLVQIMGLTAPICTQECTIWCHHGALKAHTGRALDPWVVRARPGGAVPSRACKDTCFLGPGHGSALFVGLTWRATCHANTHGGAQVFARFKLDLARGLANWWA